MTRHALTALLLALPLAAAPARAHGIESNLEHVHPAGSSGLDLQLSSHFSTGLPASEASVKLVSPDGDGAIALGRTDAEGRLRFRLPSTPRPGWELMVDAGPGHRDYLELPGATTAPTATALPGRVLRQVRQDTPWSGLALLGLSLAGGIGVGLCRRRPGGR
ncbi:MAG: hypothetical protein VKK62_02990 [Synechococcaceae cyanobacterium]|nr:hypothetical protein [Synechococcaceae cyanobacterium]